VPLFEIVPNLSEGRNSETIDAAVDAVRATGASVLHRTSDPVHHRSVLTIAGSAGAVLDAAVALAGVAAERIDLHRHRGVHPRIGALDVLPFVPLAGATLDDASALARTAAQRIWERHAIPSFLYGAAATDPHRTLLANIRAGEFEGLPERFERMPPDVGTAARHESAGAIAVGARPILVAFNVELQSGDLALARRIAAALRERSGGLRTLRALGLRLGEGVVQVSLNVTDVSATPLYRIVTMIARLAAKNGAGLRRSELIGLIPQSAVEAAARSVLGVPPPS
jgi:glutamate formiminotransferase / 5-formyltetrahydrofolate cyclo-ligase